MNSSRATHLLMSLLCLVSICSRSSSQDFAEEPGAAGVVVPLPAASSLKRILRGQVGDAAASEQAKPYDLKGVEFERISSRGKNGNNLAAALEEQPTACQLVQIVHLLQHPGCQPKAIVSFACSGSCSSYVQTSTSKFWQHERSCFCCQQTGSQEAIFTLDCPSQDPPFRKVKAFAPVDCMCRSCTDFGKEDLRPHELVEALAGEIDSRLQ